MYPGQRSARAPVWRPCVALVLQHLLSANEAIGKGVARAEAFASEAIVVTTPAQLQEAVRSGKRHVIINDHLDLTETPRFSEMTVLDTSVLAVVQTRYGEYTQSIQGNCSDPAPQHSTLDPAPKARQCVLTVREDFLEATLRGSQLWLSNLYVSLPPASVARNHSALVAALGPDVYMTDMAFVAYGGNARALDVGGDRRVYISHSQFSGFENTRDAAIRLEPGARATVTASTFTRNMAARGSATSAGSGPVMGLHTGVAGVGAAAWFDDCLFRGNVSPAPGEVAVSDRACRVYSNTRLPTVWDRELGREVAAWQLVPIASHQSPADQEDVFAEVAKEGAAFLRPTDSFLLRVREETGGLTQQSRLTAMTPGNEYTAADPYLGRDGTGALLGLDSDSDGGGGVDSRRALLIVGVCVGVLVAVAAVVWLAARCVKRHRLWPSSAALGPPPTPNEAIHKSLPPPSSKAPISTSSRPKAPPPTPDASACTLPPLRPLPPQSPQRPAVPEAKPPLPGGRSAALHGSTLRLMSGGPTSSMLGMQSQPSRLPSADGNVPPSFTTLPSSGATMATRTPQISSFGPSVAATPPISSQDLSVAATPPQQSTVCTADAWTESVALAEAAREPPGAGASARERLEYVNHQLDSLADREVLGSLVLEAGPASRMHGGQAVIQFAKCGHTGRRYALKFFLSQSAFAGEVALYTDGHSPLGRFLPQLREIAGAPGHAPAITDAHRRPLPPCIAMEKGESLDVWLQRNEDGVDMVTGLQVIQHVAERLSDLHQAGYVHRDLKQSNVMWLPRENRWTLIDFGCAARIGDDAPLSYSLKYSPPEVVLALQQEARTVRATAAMDAWALGIIAVELLSHRRVLEALEGREKVIAQILGREALPWEPEAAGSQQLLHTLGRFRGAVLGLLQRDPLLRLDAGSFVRRCRAVLEQTRASEVTSAALTARVARTAQAHGIAEAAWSRR